MKDLNPAVKELLTAQDNIRDATKIVQTINQRSTIWIYEDELPEDYPYDEMFEKSRVIDGIRMFPDLTKAWVTTEDHIRDATKMVAERQVSCACGDLYPADSFGAGFITATGHCQNCEAAHQAEQPVNQEPTGYWQGTFNTEGGAILYEVKQVPAFGAIYPNIPLYTAPPQREFVSLTDDEKHHLIWATSNRTQLVDAAEALLKEKNHG